MRYKPSEEIVLAGDFRKDIQVPEIKIRYTRGKTIGKIKTSDDVADLLRRVYGRQIELQEHIVLLFLDVSLNVLGYYKHTVGTKKSAVLDKSMIVALATQSHADAVILSHNHPSGNLVASEGDNRITKEVKSALQQVDVKLVDHMIVTKQGYYSYADEGNRSLAGIEQKLKNKNTMITAKNLLHEFGKLDKKKLPENIRNAWGYVEKYHSLYDKSEKVKEVVDKFVAKLNEELASQKVETGHKTEHQKEKPVKSKAKTPTARTKNAGTGQKKKKTKVKRQAKKASSHVNFVASIDPVLVILKKYANLDGTTRTVNYMLSFLKQVERAVIREKIAKKHEHYPKVKRIESELQRVIGKAIDEDTEAIAISLDAGTKEEYLALVASEKTRPSVNALSRYVGLKGRKDEKTTESAARLLKQIGNLLAKMPNDKNAPSLRKVEKELSEFVEGKRKSFPADANTLAGLPDIISSTELEQMEYEYLGLTGEWLELLGNVATPFTMMLFGAPGSGKSTCAIRFAGYLAKELNKHILYVSAEESFNATVKDKFTRANAFHPNIFLSKSIPERLDNFDVVFIDSVNELGFSPDELNDLIQANVSQGKSFVFVYRGTKNGTFRGDETHENLIDISLKVENGQAVNRKNRFGGSGVLEVY